MPFVDGQKFVDTAVEFSEGGMEVWGLFAEEGDKDGRIVVKGVRSHFVKELSKMLTGP